MRFAAVTSALADRGRRFDINNDRVIEIDKVVGRVGEEGEASIKANCEPSSRRHILDQAREVGQNELCERLLGQSARLPAHR